LKKGLALIRLGRAAFKNNEKMNILMKKFKRMAIRPYQEASMLVRLVSDSAFKIFTDKQFRESINFEKEKQEEQDRIWNEITVTGLLFLLAFLDDYLKTDDSDRRPFWAEVRNEIVPEFIKWLEELKIPDEFVKIWKKLIDLRMEEFKDRRQITLGMLEKELLDNDAPEFRNAFIRLHTLAISGSMHIARGNDQKIILLKKHLNAWLGVLNLKLGDGIGY
jgi:hypothetical protein